MQLKLERKVKNKNIVLFCRQFSAMINSGVNIMEALEIICSEQSDPYFKKILLSVKNSIECGVSVSESLKRFPKEFDEVFVSMVKAGEASGMMGHILQRLSDYMEQDANIKGKIKSATVYPIITLSVAFSVISVIMIFVIPVFENLFADFGKALPAATQIVVSISRFMRENFLVSAGIIILITAGFKILGNTQKGRFFTDRLKLNIPIFGNIITKFILARFSRILAALILSRVNILEAFRAVEKIGRNKVVESVVKDIRHDVEMGVTVAEALARTQFFPDMLCQMVKVGESSGKLGDMLNKTADFYEQELNHTVEGLTAAIEPCMMIFIGIVIGAIIVAMYLPVFKMAGVIGF